MTTLSNLQKIDFSTLYKEQRKLSTFKAKSAKDWDEKASDMNGRVFKSIYINEFLQRLDLKDAKTLLDVGCGPGTLGLSLADKLEKVYCLDFSPKMLKCVRENAKERGLENVQTIQKSLDESWDDVPKCDILIASRCMEVDDLEGVLQKLNKKAKKVYISYKVDGFFIDECILKVLEKTINPKPDFIYLVNILYKMGFNAKVDFVNSENTRFQAKNPKEFIEKVRWSLGEISKNDEKNLENFYHNELAKNPPPKFVKWAFISYEI
ncbi:MAG: SAM-dependent methyltransferase [Proteobacteria bacterium]|nr:MAG: SAM-dependent methyltransferase [Pseudomonadota bacterium]